MVAEFLREQTLEGQMHQERRLPFEPGECPETVWDQLPESQRSSVIELYARLMARAATGDEAMTAPATTTRGEEEVGHECVDG